MSGRSAATAFNDELRHPPILGSSVPSTLSAVQAYARRLELRHVSDTAKLRRAQTLATLPIQWLTLVKSCSCVPCLAMVRAWARTDHSAKASAELEDLQLSLIERQTLGAIGRGLTNKEIGMEIGRAESTVKNMVTRIFSILHVHTRTQAVIKAFQLGLVDPI